MSLSIDDILNPRSKADQESALLGRQIAHIDRMLELLGQEKARGSIEASPTSLDPQQPATTVHTAPRIEGSVNAPGDCTGASLVVTHANQIRRGEDQGREAVDGERQEAPENAHVYADGQSIQHEREGRSEESRRDHDGAAGEARCLAEGADLYGRVTAPLYFQMRELLQTIVDRYEDGKELRFEIDEAIDLLKLADKASDGEPGRYRDELHRDAQFRKIVSNTKF